MDDTERSELDRKRLAEAVVDKCWEIPGCEGHGPVTLALRLPEVRITDSAGRFIIISPRQSDLVGTRMTDIAEWLRYGDREWETPTQDGG